MKDVLTQTIYSSIHFKSFGTGLLKTGPFVLQLRTPQTPQITLLGIFPFRFAHLQCLIDATTTDAEYTFLLNNHAW